MPRKKKIEEVPGDDQLTLPEEETPRRGPGRPRKARPEPEAPENDEGPSEAELEEILHEEGGNGREDQPIELDGGLTGISTEQNGQRFEVAPTPGVKVYNAEGYGRLRDFISALPNKSDFNICVWRCDPLEPDVMKKRKWLGRFPIPTTLLEEAIERKWGGGHYRWQLGYMGRFAGNEDLPSTLRGGVNFGELSIEGPPREIAASSPAAPGTDAVARMEAIRAESANGQAAMMDLLKDQLKSSRQEQQGGANALVSLMTVLLTGMQQQQQLAIQMGQQQTNFLMSMMQQQTTGHKDALEEKERFLMTILQAVGAGGGASGEKSTTEKVLEAVLSNAPKLLNVISEVSRQAPQALVAPRPPAPVYQPAPALAGPPPAPAPAPAVPPQEFEGFRFDVDGAYIGDLVKSVYSCWQMKMPALHCVESIAQQGTEEQFERLVGADTPKVIALVNRLWAEHSGGEAPKELLAYVEEVHRQIKAGPPVDEFVQVPPSPPSSVTIQTPAPPTPAPVLEGKA
jgi:hypothetical protein